MERHVARYFRPALVRIHQRLATTACLSKDPTTTKISAGRNPAAPALSRASFHTKPPLYLAVETLPDHYEALELSVSASAADIKRQFYTLSKRHHPDHNRDDPAASNRFIRITEAYHILSKPDRRTKYDRDLARHRPWSENPASSASYNGTGGRRRHGSYASSSASGPAGGRPPSGLSKRRTQFRGPPPSFYSAGAWGTHGAKRAAYAPGAASRADTSKSNRREGSAAHADGRDKDTRRGSSPDYGYSHVFGTGPGTGSTGAGASAGASTAPGYDDADIWYWDKEGHFRTQHSVEQHIRRNNSQPEHNHEPGRPSDPVVSFLMVSGVLGLAIGIPAYYMERNSRLKDSS